MNHDDAAEPPEPVALTAHLEHLLRQVKRTCGLSDLCLLTTQALWLEETLFLVRTSDPHQSYLVRHTNQGWLSEEPELQTHLNKAPGKQATETEVWAIAFLRDRGYTVMEPKVLPLRP